MAGCGGLGEQLAGMFERDREAVGKCDPQPAIVGAVCTGRIDDTGGYPLQFTHRFLEGLLAPQPPKQVGPNPGDPQPLLVALGHGLYGVEIDQRLAARGILVVGQTLPDVPPIGVGHVRFEQCSGFIRKGHLLHAGQ